MEQYEIPWGPHIEAILKADIGKYVSKILSHPGTHNTRPASQKEPGLEELPGNPQENFDHWRKLSFEEETEFWENRYAETIWPPDEVRAREIERVCGSINTLFPSQILSLSEEWPTQDYYEMATLIGKIDYLKQLPGTIKISKSLKNIHKLTIEEIALYCVYMGIHVSKGNMPKEFRDNGHTSEKKMCTVFNKFINREARSGFGPINDDTGSIKKNINKHVRIQKIISILTDKDAVNKATDEANALKNEIDNYLEKKNS
jgi:hypothetical protein